MGLAAPGHRDHERDGNTQVVTQIAVPPAIPIHPRRRLRSGSSSLAGLGRLVLGRRHEAAEDEQPVDRADPHAQRPALLHLLGRRRVTHGDERLLGVLRRAVHPPERQHLAGGAQRGGIAPVQRRDAQAHARLLQQVGEYPGTSAMKNGVPATAPSTRATPADVERTSSAIVDNGVSARASRTPSAQSRADPPMRCAA